MRMQLCEFDPNQPLQTTDHFILDRKRITSEFDSNHPLQSPEEQETQRHQKNQSTWNPTQVEFRKSQKKRRGTGSFRSSSQSGETKNPNKSQARTQREKSIAPERQIFLQATISHQNYPADTNEPRKEQQNRR